MSVETASYISQLDASKPGATDPISEGDDALRLVKSVLKTQFSGLGAAAVTASAGELNILDGATISTTELNCLDGATENVQAKLNALSANAPGLILLSTVTAASSASMDIETTFSSTYDAYTIVLTGLKPAATSSLLLTLKIGGSYLSSAYRYHIQSGADNSGTYSSAQNTSAANIPVLTGITSAGLADLTIHVFRPADTSNGKSLTLDGVIWQTLSGPLYRVQGAAYNGAVSALTGVRIAMSTGNIASGTARLYGIRKS